MTALLCSAALSGAFLCAAASPAAAYTTGISGYSGKDNQTCTECHSPASAMPSATLKGPDTLAAGATGTYQLVINTDVTTSATMATSPRTAGLDVATSAGTLGTVAQVNQTRLIDGELSHTNALPKAKTVQVSFTLTAPDSVGPITLFAAALSGDGDGTNKGDSTTTTTLQVMVSALAMPDLAAPPDLAGVDLAGVDFSQLRDLSPALDAISSATMPAAPPPPRDMGPPRDEPRWSCGSYVGRNPSADAAGVALLLFAPLLTVLALRRRRR